MRSRSSEQIARELVRLIYMLDRFPGNRVLILERVQLLEDELNSGRHDRE